MTVEQIPMDKSDVEAVPRETPAVLSQERLWQAHKMVAVGRLSGSVAHEFNNLMQGIIASLELTRKLVDRGRSSEAEPFIVKAITAAQRASLFNQLVASFARPQPIAPKAMSLNTVIAVVEDLLRYSLAPTFKLEITPAADLWPVYCDAGQAEIAIVDMVLAARDSTPEGGAIAIATRNAKRFVDALAFQAAEAPRDYICITVAATGKETTESFDRRLTPPSPAGANASLGALDMVEYFARLHGGVINVRADAPQRSATELYLPRIAAA